MRADSWRSIAVNGDAIRRDRLTMGLTQEQLAERCSVDLSVETVRRAERGQRLQQGSLAAIAAALGSAPGVYVLPSEPAQPTPAPMDGRWNGYYVADSMGRSPYVAPEVIEVTRTQDGYSGRATVEDRTFGTLRETLEHTEWRSGIFVGESRIESWDPPFGYSFFQLVPLRGYDWLEGFTTWYDLDSLKMECSRYIWVRIGCQFEELYQDDAQRFMADEIQHFAQRRAAR